MPDQSRSNPPNTAAFSKRRSYKRPYQKSTRGCLSCKARKIKCDEIRPVCSNCRKRYLDADCCEYLNPATTSSSSSSSDGSSKHSSPATLPRHLTQTPLGLSNSSASQLLELRLVHHYTKSTCGQQSLKNMVPFFPNSMWEVDIPQIAFSSPIVLNALLGISALNLLSLTPNDQSLAVASRSYFHKAVTQHRAALTHVDALSAEPLLVAATLIAHHTWLAGHSGGPEESYQLSIPTYHMCQGIEALIQRTTPWLKKYEWPPKAKPHLAQHQSRPFLNRSFLDSALEDMKILSACFSGSNIATEDKEAYNMAVEEIVAIYSLVAGASTGDLPAEQEIVTILHRLPSRYLQLLESRDPLAMALLARNLALLELVDSSRAWWIHGAGECRVASKAVHSIGGLMPPEWLWAMDWPLKVITKEIKLEDE